MKRWIFHVVISMLSFRTLKKAVYFYLRLSDGFHEKNQDYFVIKDFRVATCHEDFYKAKSFMQKVEWWISVNDRSRKRFGNLANTTIR